MKITSKRVLLLLANGFEAFEAACFSDVLGWSMEDDGPRVKVETCAASKELKCTWGLTVKPDFLLGEINVNDFDALAIPGGFEEAGFYDDAFSDEFIELIQSFQSKRKPIASICVASLALANAGILKSKKATTYQMNGKRLKQLEEFGVDVQYMDQIVLHENIITSSSPATGVWVAAHLLARLTSIENANRVLGLMGYPIQYDFKKKSLS